MQLFGHSTLSHAQQAGHHAVLFFSADREVTGDANHHSQYEQQIDCQAACRVMAHMAGGFAGEDLAEIVIGGFGSVPKRTEAGVGRTHHAPQHPKAYQPQHQVTQKHMNRQPGIQFTGEPSRGKAQGQGPVKQAGWNVPDQGALHGRDSQVLDVLLGDLDAVFVKVAFVGTGVAGHAVGRALD